MIDTPRLQLVPVNETFIDDLLANNPALLLKSIRIGVPPEWNDLWIDHPGALEYTRRSLQNDPALHELGWGAYLFIHRTDHKLVGMGGYKGRPDAQGSIELGYSVVSPYRHQGLGTEATQGMVQFAFSRPKVRQVVAHTLPVDNYSNRLLKKIGFQYDGVAIEDPEDGEVWRWVIYGQNK